MSDTWRRICEILNIEQRLSTGFHPQTDGATERANQEVEKGLRIYVTVAQTDWGDWLPTVAMNINNRTAASTGISPFFFMHGYHVDPIPEVDKRSKPGSPAAVGEEFVSRMKEASNWAQATMPAAQDRQQASANRKRKPAPVYKEKDKVWLDLRNVRTNRSSKKLDWLHAKYTVTRVVSPHSVQLDVPSGIHPTFHVDLLRPAAEDPFPSQQTDDSQPLPVIIGEDAEWLIEEILCARWKKVQGDHVRREVLVKWAGYAEHSWEPLREYWDTEALDRFEEQHGIVDAYHPSPRGAPLPTASTDTLSAVAAPGGSVSAWPYHPSPPRPPPPTATTGTLWLLLLLAASSPTGPTIAAHLAPSRLQPLRHPSAAAGGTVPDWSYHRSPPRATRLPPLPAPPRLQLTLAALSSASPIIRVHGAPPRPVFPPQAPSTPLGCCSSWQHCLRLSLPSEPTARPPPTASRHC